MGSPFSSRSAARFWHISVFVLIVALLASGAALAAPAAHALGSIEGTVTAAPGGTVPLENILVYAFNPGQVPVSAVPDLSYAVASDGTDTNGEYKLDVPAGEYAVWFSDGLMQISAVPTVNDYVAQWF